MNSVGYHPQKPFCTLVLGTPYSGKTILLASLYKRLSIEHPVSGTSFFVTTPSHDHLIEIYYQLEKNRKWADPTLDFKKYTFTLQTNIKTKNDDGNITTENCNHFAFDYYDIPGQSLTDPQQDPGWAEKVDTLASKADSLLALIDGQLVLKALIENKPANLFSLLDSILPAIEKIPGKPLHFVITKWDLLENYETQTNSSEKLACVSEILHQYESFKSLIDQQKKDKIPTRLIPVSSIGNKFAILGKEGMQINPRQVPKPVRVELPIVLGLIDGLRLTHQEVNQHSTHAKSALGGWKTFRQIFDVAKPVFDNFPAPPDATLGKMGLGASITVIQNALDSYISSQEKENAKLNIQEQKLSRVISEFIKLTQKLEIEFPASILADLNH